jgi:hypothetical protein
VPVSSTNASTTWNSFRSEISVAASSEISLS